jgi:hypothetical protein
MKFKTCQVNGTGWAAVVENSAGERALLSEYIGSSHVAAVIADNERRFRRRQIHDAAAELRDEVWFATLPRLSRRITRRGRVVWESQR